MPAPLLVTLRRAVAVSVATVGLVMIAVLVTPSSIKTEAVTPVLMALRTSLTATLAAQRWIAVATEQLLETNVAVAAVPALQDGLALAALLAPLSSTTMVIALSVPPLHTVLSLPAPFPINPLCNSVQLAATATEMRLQSAATVTRRTPPLALWGAAVSVQAVGVAQVAAFALPTTIPTLAVPAVGLAILATIPSVTEMAITRILPTTFAPVAVQLAEALCALGVAVALAPAEHNGLAPPVPTAHSASSAPTAALHALKVM